MLFGIFRRKEVKITGIIIVLIILLIAAFFYKNSKESNRYSEQTVMAEQYLRIGNYEQAIEAYIKALAISDTDQVNLSIGLAQAYIGIDDYDSALKVLRECYQKTLGYTIKKKIEEVTEKKIDYEYLQVISRADIYLSKKEYDKAVIEYEKAKKIKSKEAKSYMKIAQVYIEQDKYEEARDEAKEGLTLTQSEELEQMAELARFYLQKQQYSEMVEEAKEDICQENYDDGIKKYAEAVNLIPGEEEAYKELAETYMERDDYEKAILLLKKSLNNVKSSDLKEMLKKAESLKNIKKKISTFSPNLYAAVIQLDMNCIKKYMNTKFYTEKINFDQPVYYSPSGKEKQTDGIWMIMIDSTSIYAGEIADGLKDGYGTYIMLTKNKGEQGYYSYQGQWKEDMPNGNGRVEEESIDNYENGEKHAYRIVTEGSYIKGLENGSMVKYFFTDDIKTGNLSYMADNGVPDTFINKKGMPIFTQDGESYVIGLLYSGNTTIREYYYVKKNTCWGVDPFINDK
jgi:tetratricopeptide (TPR) repeat protein